VTVYRKPTHTDQYLQFSSSHHLDHKRSVVRTLLHRADALVTDPQDKEREVEHVKNTLRCKGYHEWMFKIPSKKARNNSDSGSHHTQRKPNIGMPYVRGTSEALQRIFTDHGVNLYHWPTNSLHQQLTHVKDRTDKLQKCGVVYHIKCEQCEHDYIGKTARMLGTRVKEHHPYENVWLNINQNP